MKTRNWLLCWIISVIFLFAAAGFTVYHVDPYFHYHKPYTDKYYYSLSNVKQRSQNDGICRHFDYDALITGSSMTENFKTSELDGLFGCRSVKVPYSGGSFKEINDNLARALRANPNLKIIVRCLDMDYILESPDLMRTDLGEFPNYLYDDSIFNDAEYLLNRETVAQSMEMLTGNIWPGGKKPGITAFDDYSNWQNDFSFGINAVLAEFPHVVSMERAENYSHLSEEEKTLIKDNITRNVTDLADEYPDVAFYYYFSPYSILKWWEIKNNGTIYKVLESEKLAAELILEHKNIRLFSFNTRHDIVTNINNYRDYTHYVAWINTLILKWMHEGQYQLTTENYEQYILSEYEYYLNYDYESLLEQEDYEADYYAAALLNREITGAEPLDLLRSDLLEMTPAGAQISIDLDQGYNYLVFSGQKQTDKAVPAIRVYDENGVLINEAGNDDYKKDGTVHRLVIDLSERSGTITIFVNGSYDPRKRYDSGYLINELNMY